MKNIIFCICLISVQIGAFAQENWTKRIVNKDAKLQHHALFYSADTSLVKTCVELFTAEATKRKLAFTLYNAIDESPDVVFILDNYADAYKQTVAANAVPVFVKYNNDVPNVSGATILEASSVKQIVRKSIQMMEDFYYSGDRPRNTTVFKCGDNGYVSYRIPTAMTLPNGRILAFCETRDSFKHDCVQNDIVMKSSDDNGRTWSKLKVIADAQDASLNNPTPIYVEENNEIIVVFQKYPPKQNEGITAVGVDGDVTKIQIVRSRDNGETWGEKEDITKLVKLPKVTSQASGPGFGIRVVAGDNKGRILIPFNAVGGVDGWYNYLVYSDDLGQTWGILDGRSQYGTNESQVVQISANEFMVNARCHRFEGDDYNAPKNWNPWNFGEVTRARGEIRLTIDGVKSTWKPTKVRYDMPDPLCQGSILRYSGLKDDEKSILLFTNPASNLTDRKTTRAYSATPPIRMNGSIAVSYDDGQTWPIRKRFYGNRYTEYQYSVPVCMSDNKVGIVFEAGEEIKFAVLDMNWLEADLDD